MLQKTLLKTPLIMGSKLYYMFKRSLLCLKTYCLKGLHMLSSKKSKAILIDFFVQCSQKAFPASLFPQVSWLSESSCPPCWTPVSSGRHTVTMDGLSAWSTGFASAAIQTTTDLSATSSAGLAMTSSATSTVTPAAPRSAWRAGQDLSAKRVREETCPHYMSCKSLENVWLIDMVSSSL